MEATDTKTDFTITFESAARREETKAWRTKWVGGWEGYSTVVEAVCERGGSRRAAKGEVPLEDIVLEGMGGIVWGWVLGEFGGFFHWRLLVAVSRFRERELRACN
jgi:hypothetical protein